MDQTSTLRRMVGETSGRAPATRVLTISSGKGGVGKSNLTLNVGISLARTRKKVLIMDADAGLANMDILIGLTARNNLSHVLSGEKTLEETLEEGPGGIHLLPAASGVEWITHLSQEQKLDFLQKIDALNGIYDILLIDTGAGISSNVLFFNLAAQTRIVLVTPEPTSITDAYALIKVLCRGYQQKNFEVVVNLVESEQEGLEIYRNLSAVTDRFLDARLGYLGHVRRDQAVGKSVLRQTPVVEAFPDAAVSEDYGALAQKILQLRSDAMESNLGLFWRKMFESSQT